MNNQPIQLIRYFQSDEKPLSATEFKEFWTSCSEEEKDYFKRVDLVTGLLPE